MKFTEEQIKEIEEVVSFTADGKMNLKRVTGSVESSVDGDVRYVGGNVRGSVRGNVWGSVDNVWGNVWGSVGGRVWGSVGGE
jgi:hypothetical protein